MFSLPLKLKA
uniref:Uncharacterized protein n=1 Tax=Nymphaea colorata TaxID=210225 RepID=A0A5K1DLE3_9MAGN